MRDVEKGKRGRGGDANGSMCVCEMWWVEAAQITCVVRHDVSGVNRERTTPFVVDHRTYRGGE